MIHSSAVLKLSCWTFLQSSSCSLSNQSHVCVFWKTCIMLSMNLGLFSPINSLSTPLTLLSLISRLAFFLMLNHQFSMVNRSPSFAFHTQLSPAPVTFVIFLTCVASHVSHLFPFIPLSHWFHLFYFSSLFKCLLTCVGFLRNAMQIGAIRGSHTSLISYIGSCVSLPC